MSTPAAAGAEPWALALFRKSVLKQNKLAAIEQALGATEGLRCLDLGSDNGVVSLLLRRRGGSWASADLTDESVASIRELVKDDVFRVEGPALPFPDHAFDRVVVVDMLEHIADEAAFAAELARVTKPRGHLVVNTPHLKETALRRLRESIGLTDEKHGHVRPGYTVASLSAALSPHFGLDRARTYSRFFTEAIDTAINWGVERLGKKSSAKGMVVTASDLQSHRKAFRAYSLVYPAFWAISRLDGLLPGASGYMLLATLTRHPD